MEQELPKILFKPQAGKLRQIYPELKANKKFEDIPNDEFLFVWYYACLSSPIDPGLPDAIRARTAAAEALKDHDKKRKFSSLEFPEKIKEAIEEMKKYNPDVRMLAKRIIQTTFNNLEKLTNVDTDSFTYEDAEGKKRTDWTGRKQYVDSVAKISETLPSLIAQMEHGFGIVEDKERVMKKSIHTFHENNLD
jgi:hypothetical protein